MGGPTRQTLAILALGVAACRSPMDPEAPVAAPPPAAVATDPSSVRIHGERIGMFTLLGTDAAFRLAITVDDPRDVQGVPSRDLGVVRSAVVVVDEDTAQSLECGWRARGVGETTDYCHGRDPLVAREAVRPRVEASLDELRSRGGVAGATDVARATCYCTRARANRPARFWCEGLATRAVASSTEPPAPPDPATSAAPRAHSSASLAPSRWVLGASGEAGFAAEDAVLAAKLFLRVRPFASTRGAGVPIEVAFEPAWAPSPKAVALGLGAFVRPEMGRSGFALVAGGNIAGSKGRDDDGWFDAMLLRPSAGVSWQLHASAPAVEPLLELTGGWTFATAGAARDPAFTGPSAMIAVGLVWPEVR